MIRSCFVLVVLLAACQPEPPSTASVQSASQELGGLQISRDHIVGDVYHYGFTVPVGKGPNARIVLHRVVRESAPWVVRHTTRAVMMMHGDFATFATNFLPVLGNPPSSATGIATWLAQAGIDVWGVDRRWTQAPELGADLSDFGAMGLNQELDDLDVALAFARGTRLITDASVEKMTLVGFSRGGQLAYFHASRDATRPPGLRHDKGLVPLDVYASLAPGHEAERQFNCDNATFEYDALAGGEVDVPNDFQYTVGRLALSDPAGASPYFPGRTNREAVLIFAGRTLFFFPATPHYHLNAPLFANGRVVGLRSSSESVVAKWLAGSAPHQSLLESAETDALVCGDQPLPADVPLSRIKIPLLLIAAAGGYGDYALHSTTQVKSADVTTLVVRQLPVGSEVEDFGHADLLFSPDAPALAWQPLLNWLNQR